MAWPQTTCDVMSGINLLPFSIAFWNKQDRNKTVLLIEGVNYPPPTQPLYFTGLKRLPLSLDSSSGFALCLEPRKDHRCKLQVFSPFWVFSLQVLSSILGEYMLFYILAESVLPLLGPFIWFLSYKIPQIRDGGSYDVSNPSPW